LLQDLLAIGHLWNSFGRNKAYCIDVLKSRNNQSTKVTRLKIRWDLSPKTLPGVTWALDQFDRIVRHRDTRALFEKILRAFEKTLAQGRVFVTAKRCEFLKLAALLRVQARWHFDN